MNTENTQIETFKIKIAVLFLALAITALLLSACSNLSRPEKGAVIGTAAGGNIGAVIGRKAGNTAVGAIIGGAIGGTAGALIAHNMDQEAEEIKKNVPGAEVISRGEGLIVKFDSGILFDAGKDELKDIAKANIRNLAATMKNNPDTDIMIIGHTDGTEEYNQDLSERRARSVRDYAVASGVQPSRLTTTGKGELEPIADNTTDAGKAQNRRVEIVILASDKMKEDAKQGKSN